MAFENDDLDRALEALTIFRVWEVAARDGAILTADPVPQRDGLVKSPFRDDGRRGSFSICHGGKGYNDFGGDKSARGNVWQFARLCWPNEQKKDTADRLIEISGITRTARAAHTSNAQTDTDPRLLKAAKAMQKRDAARAREEAVYEAHEKQLEPSVEAKSVPDWPDFVRARFEEGNEFLRGASAKVAELARARGWPAEWVGEVLNMDLLSYAPERWCDLEHAQIRRQKAFRVDRPEIKIVPHADGAKATAVLRPIGYHQRFYIPADARQAEQKGWVYVPSVPRKTPRSKFEHRLLEHAAALGVTPEESRGLIPPLPFVMGDLDAPKVIVIIEGQWDAISFFGACGWFEDSNPPVGVAVFGIRGAQGVDPFLAYWSKWIRHNRPLAWVIADNDTAGKTWTQPPAAKPGLPRPPSFPERLEHAGCRNVLTSWLQRGAWGKDFNDYYRAAKPGPVQMNRWMQRVGVLSSGNIWA